MINLHDFQQTQIDYIKPLLQAQTGLEELSILEGGMATDQLAVDTYFNEFQAFATNESYLIPVYTRWVYGLDTGSFEANERIAKVIKAIADIYQDFSNFLDNTFCTETSFQVDNLVIEPENIVIDELTGVSFKGLRVNFNIIEYGD